MTTNKAWLLLAASVAAIAGCEDEHPLGPGTGSLVIRTVHSGPADGQTGSLDGLARAPRAAASHLDEVGVKVTGPTPVTLSLTKVAGGFEGRVENLKPGTYEVDLVGLVGGEADMAGRTTGIEVKKGKETAANVPWGTFVPTLNAFGSAQTTLMKLVVTYSSVAAADSYVVELDRTAQFPSPTRTTVKATTAELPVSDSGAYYVRVRAKSAQVQQTGRASSAQSIRVVRDGNEPNNSVASAVALGFAPANSTTSAQNILPGDADWFYLGACQGDNLVVETRAARLTPPSPLNTRLDLYDEAGTVLASNDDGSGTGTDSRIQWAAASSGLYSVQVLGVGTSVGHYDLAVQVTRGANNTGSSCSAGYPRKFGGTLSRSGGGFADTLVVKPGKFLPWDGDEVITVAGATAWIVSRATDSIVFLVPNAPVAKDTLRISKQGSSTQNITQDTLLDVTSKFTAKSDTAGTTNIANGPFPQTLFVSVSEPSALHLLKVSRTLPLGLSVTLEWQDPVDLDVSWFSYLPALRFTGNLSGFTTGTSTRVERSTVGVPGRATWYLGVSTRDTNNLPEQMAKVTIAEASVFASLSVGWSHTCGIKSGGTAYCWGNDSTSQLGDGATTNRTAPAAVSGSSLFTGISAGFRHTCGVTVNDEVYCWGANTYGQLGDGTTTSRSVPTKIAGTIAFAWVSAGVDHTCGVATSGQVYCWGSNQFGELGVSSVSGTCAGVPCRTTAIAVSNTLPFLTTTTGNALSCGLRTAAFIWCWGYNVRGQLGDGTTTNSSMTLTQGTNYRQVGAFLFHTCATRTDGTGYCWGNNADGQLGIGVADTLPHSTPQQVSSPADWAAIVGGRFHSCGVREQIADLTAFGSPYCWGSNFNGKLGDGSTSSRTSPVLVSGGLVAQAVHPGSQHSCTLAATAQAYCWGLNSSGQLGNSSTASSTTPVPVSGQPSPAPPLVAESAGWGGERSALPAIVQLWSRLGAAGSEPRGGLPLVAGEAFVIRQPYQGPKPGAAYWTLPQHQSEERAAQEAARRARPQ